VEAEVGAAEPGAAAGAPRELSSAALDGVGHSASGRTRLVAIDGVVVVRFEDVDVEGTPGPYVHLVPAGARTPDGGVPLGPLKAERGSFGYELPTASTRGAVVRAGVVPALRHADRGLRPCRA
jgi:hypothetical protein